jgi:hypothetical protein
LVIKDALIIKMVERIGEHYRANISNRFLTPALLHAPLGKETWDLIEILAEKSDQYESQGFHLEDLYRQILAAAQFVAAIRRDVAPVIRNRIPPATGQDKVFRDMAVNNFNSNIQVFADMLSDLYVNLVEMDKANTKARGRPIYTTIPELEDVGRLLIGQ